MSKRSAVVALGLWTAAASCSTERPRTAADPSPADRWHYDVTLDAPLTHADVRVCFEGARPRELRAGTDDAAIYLEAAHWLSPGPGRKLPTRGGKVQLQGQPATGCLRYRVNLERASGQGLWGARRANGTLLAGPALWLWRPERRAPGSRATLRLHLPPGVRASLPWKQVGDHVELTASDFRYRAHAAFGDLSPVAFEQDGAEVEVTALPGAIDVPPAQIESWMRAVVGAVSDVRGRFPVERLQVILARSMPSREPVPFGTVGRSGGASVLLFASPGATAEALRGDWVLPHELSHLLLPYVEREDAWLPEGFATYYQEVLRARAGLRDERRAWGALLRSMRGAARWGTGRDLARESADMHVTGAYRRVYWAGAALALSIDAALRHTSGGSQSLDSAIANAPWWRESPRTWSASEVLAALDASTQGTLFDDTCTPALRSDDFPAVQELFERLGVREQGGRIELSDEAPWAHVRRAIMSPRADLAARRAAAAPPRRAAAKARD